MNTLGWKSVVASLGAHALVIAALVRVPARAAPMADAPKPLEVSVVAVPAPAASETAAPGAGAAPARPVRAITGSVPHRAAPARPEPPPRAGGQPKLLSMRGPTEVHVPAPWQIGQPEGPPAADQLPPAALGAPLRAPAPSGGLGPNVVPDGDGGYREDHIAFTGHIDRDGTIHFKDKANIGVDSAGALPLLVFMTGHFDITEALMRLHGEDPYRYEKAKLMERTRDERAAMALADRADKLHEAVARMPAYLEKVWAHTAWPARARRAALFALWQEVAEDGDDAVVSTGRMVRATIVAFIRRRLPEGGPDGFTDEEIEALNRRRSCKARFEPYR